MLLAEPLAGVGHDVCATAAIEAEAVIAATRYRPDLMIVDAGLGRASDKLRLCEAERLAIQRAGCHRISLRRDPQGRRIRKNGPGIRRMSAFRKKI
jgi:hypothetical protein